VFRLDRVTTKGRIQGLGPMLRHRPTYVYIVDNAQYRFL
jgi:hypothetical protein